MFILGAFVMHCGNAYKAVKDKPTWKYNDALDEFISLRVVTKSGKTVTWSDVMKAHEE